MTNAAGYTRLSQQSDTSIERQKEHITAYATDHGFDLTTIYDDGEGASGFDTNREAYDQLVVAARDGTVEAIIVNDRSRLGRDKWQRMEHFSSLVRHGVAFHTVQDGFIDPDKPTVLLEEAMYAQQHDEGKREEIEKAREAVHERQNQGYWQGRPPFGMEFDADGQYLTPSDKFHVAIRILRLRDDGATYSDIEEETGVARTTAHRIVERDELYLEHAEG